MLAAIGVSSVDDLFASIPAEVRKAPDLPPPLSEIEVRRLLGALAAKNANARDTAFFLGAGIYHHYVSAIADQMLYRAEWLTSYTPYQPEVSQGTLQSIFEFQTHVCLLTGLDVANASLYEGASALVEALLMASRLSRGRTPRRALRRNPPGVPRDRADVLRQPGLHGGRGAPGRGRRDRPRALAAAVDDDTFAVAVQSPNFYGVVEDWAIGSRAAHEKGALSVAVVAEAVSLALLAPPGERDADIACGEAQSLGCPCTSADPCSGSSRAAPVTSARSRDASWARRGTPKAAGRSASRSRPASSTSAARRRRRTSARTRGSWRSPPTSTVAPRASTA